MENRITPRKRVVLPGRLVLAEGGTLDCRVRDLSETGARLRLGTVCSLPSHFSLQVLSSGSIHEAEVVWGRGVDIGVKFI